MKLETIYCLERLNLGNFSHIEMSAEAKLEDGEGNLEAMLALKALVHAALNGKAEEIAKKYAPSSVEEVTPEEVVTEPVTTPEEVKEEPETRKTRTTKPKADTEVKTPVVKSDSVQYNREIEQHRTVLSSYLGKTFPEWKAKPGVKEFTMTLVGTDFLDDGGFIVRTFKDSLDKFFA